MKLIKIGALIGLGIFFMILIGNISSTYNKEIRLKNAFTQKLDERKAFYDKMFKVISQKGQIAVRNDSSFRKNVDIIMSGRKDASQIVFKWITESNPNANFEQVTALYADLSRSVEAQREGFFVQEKYLQDVELQHNNLLHQFPSNMFFSIIGTKDLVYEPISSSQTEAVFTTGMDDSIKVF